MSRQTRLSPIKPGCFALGGVNELEEQIAAVGADGQVADLVDDQQAVTGEKAHALRQVALPLGLAHPVQDLGRRAKVGGSKICRRRFLIFRSAAR